MKLLVAVAVAVAVSACAARPTCVLPTPVHGAPFLWRVSRGDGPVIWLFGTVHNAGTADVPAAAWRALESSARFVSELGDLEPDREKLRELVRLPKGKGLDQRLSAEDWWDLRDALLGVVPEQDLRWVRPWYAMSKLTRKLSPSPDPTIDVALARRARARHLPVDHLETWDEQLAALGDSVSLADLEQAIHERATVGCTLDRLRANYNTGDLVEMERVLNVASGRSLVDERNRRWLPQIEGYAAQGAFIAVGLGHMFGDVGLLVMLERAGYVIERAPR